MNKLLINLIREKKDEFITFDKISKTLNISLNEVSKQMDDLKKLGYRIEFIPYRGFKLVDFPDKITPYEIEYKLNSKIVGRHIFCFDKIDSTNNKAKELAADLKTEGTVVFANSQSRGRGRMHRKWVSPEGGLYFSVIFKPKHNYEKIAKIYLLSSVSVAEVLRKLSGLNCLIKWPNDIIINDKKIAGILTETSIHKGQMDFLILGIGINVNTALKMLPSGSTSLIEESKKKYSLTYLAKEMLNVLDEYYIKYKKEGISFAVSKWKKLSYCLGSRIKVIHNTGQIEGMAVDIDEDTGALLIRDDNGFIKPIMSIDDLTVQKE